MTRILEDDFDEIIEECVSPDGVAWLYLRGPLPELAYNSPKHNELYEDLEEIEKLLDPTLTDH